MLAIGKIEEKGEESLGTERGRLVREKKEDRQKTHK